MNDYDFGKYYRNKNKKTPGENLSRVNVHHIYRRISLALAASLILFFAGLMTGMHFQEKRIVEKADLLNPQQNTRDVVQSADIPPKENENKSPKNSTTALTEHENLKDSLRDPENEFIILARRYNENSKERALYYAGVLSKISKEYNYNVIPSVRGKSIKIYVGPMKGKRNAEKMLARVKSIPEFTNSAILYKK